MNISKRICELLLYLKHQYFFQTKIKSSNHKQIEKNQENKPQHENLSKKRGSSDLKKITDYTTLPLYTKQYLNYTIMHLSTTTKNKLQRIKYNKV
jgi:hypothetical protein